MHSKETVTSAGSTDTLRKNVGVRAMEGQRSLNVHNVERNIMDICGYGATHHPTKIHSKEDWKGDRKGKGKGTQKGGKFKGGQGGNHGKGRGKKGQRLNEIAEPPEEQWTCGSWEQWSEQSWNTEADTASWRDDDWYTADSNSQTSAAAEEFQHASVGDLRLSNLVFVKHIESFQHERLNPFGIDTAACKTVVPTNHPAARWYLVHKDSPVGCAYSTAGRDKVYDQVKRILCTSDETGKPMAIQSRKVNCRRPLMAVTEMTDCGRWVCFGPQRQGFSSDPRTGEKIEFTPTPGGWDLTMKLEPPERGNKILNKAIQEISAKKRAAAVTRDYGAITDTDELVRIMGRDPFRRPVFSL